MGFDYEKIKAEQEGESWWASYADLFTVLSALFLFLYVSASLRTGTFGIQKEKEYQNIQAEVEDLRQQIKVYNTLKDNYLQTGATQEEQQVYKELMDKLVLLKEEARQEKEDLRKAARENEEKETALNKYQQVVRNIINANMLAAARVKRRDLMIDDKEQTISEKQRTISSLEQDVKQKEQAIRENNTKIDQMNAQLERKIKDLKKAHKAQKISKAKLNKRIKDLRTQNEKKVAELKEEISRKIASVKSDFDQKMKEERAAFERQMKAHKMSAQARAAAQAKFKAQAEQREKELAERIASMTANEAQLSEDLKKAKALINAKKNLIKKIQENLAKSGLKATVDNKTGDVIIKFGDEYFDTGKAGLKPGMKKILHQFMPLYTKSLFSDPKMAEKIKNVEIIGYASPTYQGKYVNPVSLSAENKEAVNYNLDLSYYRARSIFDYIFDTKKMKYNFQKKLLSRVKVTGRSFLAGKVDREIARDMSQKEYCERYDCKKAQRVIIRFDLEN